MHLTSHFFNDSMFIRLAPRPVVPTFATHPGSSLTISKYASSLGFLGSKLMQGEEAVIRTKDLMISSRTLATIIEKYTCSTCGKKVVTAKNYHIQIITINMSAH